MKKNKMIIFAIIPVVIIVFIVLILNGTFEGQGPKSPYLEERGAKFLKLDKEIVKDTFAILSVSQGRNLFYNFDSNELNLNDLSNEDIQAVAYFSMIQKDTSLIQKLENYVEIDGKTAIATINKSDMDKAVKRVFGKIKYTPTYVTRDGDENVKLLEYNAEEEKYYLYSTVGSIPTNIIFVGTESIAKYSDRYEIIQKTVYMDYEDNTVYSSVKKDNALGDLDVSGIELLHKMYVGEDDFSEETNKIIEKYYDQVTTYKHTFKRAFGGSYYWVKSEIVK